MKEKGSRSASTRSSTPGVVRRVERWSRASWPTRATSSAEVTSKVEPLPTGPKLVKVVFDVQEGPKVKIRTITFNGNTPEVGDGTLAKQMKSTKAHSWLSWIGGKGIYQEAKFEEDAEKVVEYYRNKGYISARVGTPECSKTARTRTRAGSS